MQNQKHVLRCVVPCAKSFPDATGNCPIPHQSKCHTMYKSTCTELNWNLALSCLAVFCCTLLSHASLSCVLLSYALKSCAVLRIDLLISVFYGFVLLNKNSRNQLSSKIWIRLGRPGCEHCVDMHTLFTWGRSHRSGNPNWGSIWKQQHTYVRRLEPDHLLNQIWIEWTEKSMPASLPCAPHELPCHHGPFRTNFKSIRA